MNFWKQVPTLTKICLAILVYLAILLVILAFIRVSSEDSGQLSLREMITTFFSRGRNLSASKTPNADLQTQIPADAAALRAGSNLQVFDGPGVEYPVIAYLEAGQVARIVGVSENKKWWVIDLPYFASGRGWISVDNVEAKNATNVPVVTPDRIASQATPTIENKARAVAIANVNIRSGPDMKFMKIGSLKNEQTAEIVGLSPDRLWWLINVPDTENVQGWISRDYVLAQSADNVPVISDENDAQTTIAPKMPYLVANWTINIRSGPDITYALVGQLSQGQLAEIVGVNPDGLWWSIRIPGAQGGQGWVAAAYVTASNIENVPVIK